MQFRDSLQKYRVSQEAKKPEHLKHFNAPLAPSIQGLVAVRGVAKRNPILKPSHFAETSNGVEANPGSGINAPSVIEVPEWVSEPRGRFYLYTSHPTGTYIRLSTADEVTGPYTVEDGGAQGLSLSALPFCGGHVANPSAYVDNDAKQILLYFHCGACIASDAFSCGVGGEVVFLGVSKDGVSFTVEPRVVYKQSLNAVRVGSWLYHFSYQDVFASRNGVNDLGPHGSTWMNSPSPLFHAATSRLFLAWADEGARGRRMAAFVV